MVGKRVIAVIMSVVLAVGLLPMAAYANDAGSARLQAGNQAASVQAVPEQEQAAPGATFTTMRTKSPRRILKETTSDRIFYFRYLDSAKTQAVAITGASARPYMGTVKAYQRGKVWLISNGEATCLLESDSMAATSELTKLYSVDGGKIFVVEGALWVTNSRSAAWFIRNGKATALPEVVGNFTMTSRNEFKAWHSTYDVGKNGTGHSWKYYYYRWTGKRLVEYGGREITKAQLGRAKGGKRILRAIARQGRIGKIFYRDNGIVNVNYTTSYSRENVTLRFKSGSVRYAKVNAYGKTQLGRATDGGVYRKRNPDNSGTVAVTYPKSLPKRFKAPGKR